MARQMATVALSLAGRRSRSCYLSAQAAPGCPQSKGVISHYAWAAHGMEGKGLTGKHFGSGDAPNIIHMSEAGYHAMTQCRALGYSIEYTRAGIRIIYPPPNEMQAIAYSLEDFMAITRNILDLHGVDTSMQQSIDDVQSTEDEILSDDSSTASIAHLIALSRKIIEQRETWKGRALEAERELAALRMHGMRSGNGEGRYGKLKRIIAQELHPDNQADAVEKQMKAEIFKVVWRRVQEIEKDG